MHAYEVRPRKDKRGFDLISNAAAICVYDDAGNVIETHEHAGEFKRVVSATLRPKSLLVNTVRFILLSDKDEDACRQRQYACNNSRDGKTGDCREADHDQINGKQEPSDVFGEDEVH